MRVLLTFLYASESARSVYASRRQGYVRSGIGLFFHLQPYAGTSSASSPADFGVPPWCHSPLCAKTPARPPQAPRQRSTSRTPLTPVWRPHTHTAESSNHPFLLEAASVGSQAAAQTRAALGGARRASAPTLCGLIGLGTRPAGLMQGEAAR